MIDDVDERLHRVLSEADGGYETRRRLVIDFARNECTPGVRRAVLRSWLGIEENEDEATDDPGAPASGG